MHWLFLVIAHLPLVRCGTQLRQSIHTNNIHTMKELADLQGPIHLFNNRRQLNGADIINQFIVNGNEKVSGIHQAFDSDAKRGLQILCNMLDVDYNLLMGRVDASFPGAVPTMCANGVNSATCYCGTATCDTGSGLKCVIASSTCSFPICTNTAGSTSNSADCACGSATCTSSSGRYCTSSANSCSANPICANTAGSTLNSADCHCGSATCISSSGRYCTSSDNSCSANPICVHDEDGTLNSADCDCGSTTCTSSSGRYCTSSTNSCSANPPPADQFYAKLFDDTSATYFYEVIVQIKRVGATSNCIDDNGNGGAGTSCEGNQWPVNNCCSSTGNDCTTARPCTDLDRPLNWYKLGVNSGTTAYRRVNGESSTENWYNFELVRSEKYAVIAKDSYGDGWARYQLQISTSTAESDNIVSITVENTNSGWFANGYGGTAGYLVYSSGGWKFAHVGCGVFATANDVTDADSKYTPSVFFGGSASTENEFAFTCANGYTATPAVAVCTIGSNRDCGSSGGLEDKCISAGASWNSATCNS